MFIAMPKMVIALQLKSIIIQIERQNDVKEQQPTMSLNRVN